MNIAIQAADLDNNRIDGTRVYLLNVLKYFGKLSPGDNFFIYHRDEFNSQLAPPEFANYKEKKISFPFYWTQTRFTAELWKNKPDRLWMPMQSLPFARPLSVESTVTIHDLAFKYFPNHFPKKDLRRLNFFTDFAVNHSDKIIAVSESTKKDILKFYPKIKEEKIKIIHHGFNADLFSSSSSEVTKKEVLNKYNLINPSYKLQVTNYILYVGAIQPRKNLKILIKAFEKFKQKTNSPVKLVLAGSQAWMWEETMKAINESSVRENIVLTGRVNFEDLAVLYRNASLFVFPSLYEGFGIPVLEAFASKVPVICSDNSSLPEVGGEAAEYFESSEWKKLSEKMEMILNDKEKQKTMIDHGLKQLEKFSWEKCAKETLDWIKK